MREVAMRDGDVRQALLAELRRSPPALSAWVREEVDLGRGQVRADVVCVSSHLHGYEVKSAVDNLRRLPAQVRWYSQALCRCTLVTAERHLAHALPLLPPWWGVQLASPGAGGVALVVVRPSLPNPGQVVLELAGLLWREEAQAALEARGQARGVRGKPRAALYSRMVETMTAEEVRAAVCAGLTTRQQSGLWTGLRKRGGGSGPGGV